MEYYENWFAMNQQAPWIGLGFGLVLLVVTFVAIAAITALFGPLMLVITWLLAKVGAGIAQLYRHFRPA